MKVSNSNNPGRPWLAAASWCFLLAACGGGESLILGADGLPVAAPVVTLMTPLPSATGVPTNTQVVTAVFNQAMDASTLTANSFVLACPAAQPMTGATVTYLADSQNAALTLAPGSALPSNTVCQATLTTAVKDSTGRPLDSDFSWQFTVGAGADAAAPVITGTTSANGATNVDTNVKVGATFSEAMNPLSITNGNFSVKQTVSGAPVAGSTSYSGLNAVFSPTNALAANTSYTATIRGGASGVSDLAAATMAADRSWSWSTGAGADHTAPLVTLVNPTDLSQNVPVTSSVNATFNEAMSPLTINSANFTVTGVSGVVTFNALDKIATFLPTSSLAPGTTYTATVKVGASDLAGNPMLSNKVWRFTTASVVAPPPNLISAAPFGNFGGTAGMTNTGTLTVVNGNIGSIATGTSMITGFHDTSGDIYTETPANRGTVNGKINSCTNSITGPTSTGPNAASCAIATQARLDAQTAYQSLVARPVGGASPAPGANLAGVTLLPGTYVAPGGSFMIQGGNLTLDAQGDANAVWVFKMATTLTVGGPGAAFPQSIILAGGALAKNVYWQVGSFATINAAGGGTMVGTIIAQSGASFSTVGNVNLVTLQGRALSLGASVTVVNTVINVPAL